VLLALLLALVATGCGPDPQARLDAIATDPMAQVDLAMAVESRVSDSAGSTGLKPTPARIRHTFTVPSGQFQAAIDELASEAEAAGWELRPRATVGFDGARTIDGYDAQLLIDGIESQDRVWVEVSAQDG
jgi:hypothetical protein